MKTSRRRFARLLGGGATAAALGATHSVAQDKPAEQPKPAAAATPPAQENELRKYAFSMATEPAFVFRVVDE